MSMAVLVPYRTDAAFGRSGIPSAAVELGGTVELGAAVTGKLGS